MSPFMCTHSGAQCGLGVLGGYRDTNGKYIFSFCDARGPTAWLGWRAWVFAIFFVHMRGRCERCGRASAVYLLGTREKRLG